jgi:hypothetical protein
MDYDLKCKRKKTHENAIRKYEKSEFRSPEVKIKKLTHLTLPQVFFWYIWLENKIFYRGKYKTI